MVPPPANPNIFVQAPPTPTNTQAEEHLAKLAISELALAVKDQFDLDPATGQRINTLKKHVGTIKKIFSPLDEGPQPDHNDAEAWLRRANNPNYHKLLCTTLTSKSMGYQFADQYPFMANHGPWPPYAAQLPSSFYCQPAHVFLIIFSWLGIPIIVLFHSVPW